MIRSQLEAVRVSSSPAAWVEGEGFALSPAAIDAVMAALQESADLHARNYDDFNPPPRVRSWRDHKITDLELSVRTIATCKRVFGGDVTLGEACAKTDAWLIGQGFSRKSIRELREFQP